MASVHTPQWVKDAVFYQIFPDRFARGHTVPKPSGLQPWGDPPHPQKYQGGDLIGIIENMDYLENLGVNALYLCPIFQSASNHRYHTHDYFNVDPMLGGNIALRHLLDEAHSRGIKIVLDGVFNHASRGFFQFNDILESGANSAYLDWFHIEKYPLAPYDSKEHAGYVSWWNNRALPKFNTSTPAVREFLWSVAEYWIEFGIDGWRLDVPNEIDDDTFWQEFRKRVKAINPEAYLVGEIWEDATRWLQGDQFDAVMNYLFTRPVIQYFGGKTLQPEVFSETGYASLEPLSANEFAQTMTDLLKRYPMPITEVQLNLLGSHDTPRLLSIVGGDTSAYELAHLFQMTYIGTPCIYYGDEIGMLGGRDPDCRRAFPWDQPETWNTKLLVYSKRLIEARKSSQALKRGKFRFLHAQDDVLVYTRHLGHEHAFVFINSGVQSAQVCIPEIPTGQYVEILSEQTVNLSPNHMFTLPPRSGQLYLSLI
ncbi:MAG: glycoside hydrolase family 13 protein [Deinococcaceae bacterium]